MLRLRVHLEKSIMVGFGARSNGRLSIKIGSEGKQAFNYSTTSYHKAKVACDPDAEKQHRRTEKVTLVIGRKITLVKDNLSNLTESQCITSLYVTIQHPCISFSTAGKDSK